MPRRLTADEKRTIREEGLRREKIDRFKTRVARLRAQAVIKTSSDLFQQSLHDALPDGAWSVVHASIQRVESLLDDYKTQVRWLGDKVREQERHIEENNFYASLPFQNVDTAVQTHARLYQAIESAREICSTFKIYCPLLHSTRTQQERNLLISLDAVNAGRDDVSGPQWLVRSRQNGESFYLDASSGVASWNVDIDKSTAYVSEDHAWLAAMAVAGENL